MLRLSGTVYLKTFAILYLRRTNLSHTTSPHLSFTPNLRLISSSNYSRLSPLAPLHIRFSGSLNLALFSFHITIIVTVSLISSHFICYTAYYCSILSDNKPPSSFHSCLGGFYRHSKSPHSSSLLFSHLISSYVIIFCHSHFIMWGNLYRYCYRWISGTSLNLNFSFLTRFLPNLMKSFSTWFHFGRNRNLGPMFLVSSTYQYT